MVCKENVKGYVFLSERTEIYTPGGSFYNLPVVKRVVHRGVGVAFFVRLEFRPSV